MGGEATVTLEDHYKAFAATGKHLRDLLAEAQMTLGKIECIFVSIQGEIMKQEVKGDENGRN